jgi:putative component of toxin-antitoxin plasmid stabilization module
MFNLSAVEHPNTRLILAQDTGYILVIIRNKSIILLCGGDKKTRSKDIEKAKKYW